MFELELKAGFFTALLRLREDSNNLKEDIRNYARLGFVHHMLYPKCKEDPDYHTDTLLQFIERNDMETFDCCLPYGEERRRLLIPAIKKCGKEVVYAGHLVPVKKISPSSALTSEQGSLRIIFQDQINMAEAIGATGFVFVSGPADMSVEKEESKTAFRDFCRWFCGELKLRGIDALLEPFDSAFDKKFLFGPTAECIELIHSLEPDIDNLGINLDFAHIPLMFEEFAHAVTTTAPYLRRVHLGNCVMGNTASPWYGDYHPPIGFEEGEIDTPELAEHLRLLLESGYLNNERRGALILEMQPFPNRSPDETIEDTMERLHNAWDMV